MYKLTLLEPICEVIYYTCRLIFKWATIEISKYVNVSGNFHYFIPRCFKYSNTIFIFGCHSSIWRPNRIRLMKSHNLIDQIFLGLFCLFGLFSSKTQIIKKHSNALNFGFGVNAYSLFEILLNKGFEVY